MATRAPREFVQNIRIFFHLCVIFSLMLQGRDVLLSPLILLPFDLSFIYLFIEHFLTL